MREVKYWRGSVAVVGKMIICRQGKEDKWMRCHGEDASTTLSFKLMIGFFGIYCAKFESFFTIEAFAFL